jgi:hypothetical protein
VSRYEQRRAERAASRTSGSHERRVDRRGERSTYEGRSTQQGQPVFVMTVSGKWLGTWMNGVFEAPQPCCANPMECHRRECWRPVGMT